MGAERVEIVRIIYCVKNLGHIEEMTCLKTKG